MTHYNLMDPAELAELGWFSNDPLTHVLGASLRDHVEESEYLHTRHEELSNRLNELERMVHELKSHNAYLSGMVAGFQDANQAKKKKA